MSTESMGVFTQNTQPSGLRLVEENNEADSVKGQHKILCVDDEPEILDALARMLKRSGYLIDTETQPVRALDLVAKYKYDIIISDMRMPAMDGAEFLAATEKFSPDSLRILLTGYSDQEATVRAINEGKVYGYISKPWNNKAFKAVVEDALLYKCEFDKARKKYSKLKQTHKKTGDVNRQMYKQIHQVNDELLKVKQQLNVSHGALMSEKKAMIEAFSELVNLKLNRSVAFTRLISRYARDFAEFLQLKSDTVNDISYAAMLYPLGKLFLPWSLVYKPNNTMSAFELKRFNQHPRLGYEFLKPIKQMEGIANIILYYQKKLNKVGASSFKAVADIPFESKVLSIIVDFFEQFIIQKVSIKNSIEKLSEGLDEHYDRAVFKSFVEYIEQINLDNVKAVSLGFEPDNLVGGDVLSQNIYSANGMLLLAKGSVLTEKIIETIQLYFKSHRIYL